MKKRSAIVWLCSMLVVGLVPPAPAHGNEPEPVAMTTDVQGPVWLVEGGKSIRLGVLSYLITGARVRVDAGAKVAITYFSTPRSFEVTGTALLELEVGRVRSVSGAVPLLSDLDPGLAASGRNFSIRQRTRQRLAAVEMKSWVPEAVSLDVVVPCESPAPIADRAASFSERLLYAVRLEESGHTREAKACWKTLAAERPEDDALQSIGKQP